MLKPDGNREEVLVYLLTALLHEDCMPLQIIRGIKFSPELAMDFYPKNDEWCCRYGKKLYTFLVHNRMEIPAMCKEEGGIISYFKLGSVIFTRMSEYLSGKACCSCVLFETSGDPFAIARKIVGESPIPGDCSKDSLRHTFSAAETIEASYSENRALHNVAHSCENKEELYHELGVIIKALRDKRTSDVAFFASCLLEEIVKKYRS